MALLTPHDKAGTNQSVSPPVVGIPPIINSKNNIIMEESKFNVACLFKVNLLPGTNCATAALSFRPADLARVKAACTLQKTELETDNIKWMVERENAFCEAFERDILPERQ